MNRRDFIMAGTMLSLAQLTPLKAAHAANEIVDQFRSIPKAAWAFAGSVHPNNIDQLTNDCARIGISHLWLGLGPDMLRALSNPVHPGWQQLRNLKTQGTNILALSGEAGWCYRAQSVPKYLQEILQLPNFNTVFSGVHLDIEPHTLPQWKNPSQSESLARDYITLLKSIRRMLPVSSRLEIDITHLYERMIPKGTDHNLTQTIAGMVDGAAFMTYQTPWQNAIKSITPSLKTWPRTGSQWWMGVHCEQTKSSKTSYSDYKPLTFMKTMIDFHQQLSSKRDPHYMGLAFYELSGLRQLSALIPDTP